jgi:CheY-like chemotaxis protein
MAEHRVLILEDEAIIAWDIEAELQGRGITVAGVAGHVADAMALLETASVTVAVLDINVGVETSYDVARASLAKGITVIFLTGDTGEERPDDLKDCAIVAKPVDYNLLMQALQQAGV